MSIKKTGKHNTTNISFNRIFCQDYKILWTLFYFIVEFGYRGNISQAITLFRVLYLWVVNSTQYLQIFCLVALLPIIKHGSISDNRRLLRSEKQQNHKIFTVKTWG